MSLGAKLRRGEGPFWGPLKRAGKAVVTFHLPVNAVTRPVFGLLYRLHVAAREGLSWAARFFWNEPLFRSQCAAVGPGLRMEQLPYLQGRGRIVLGSRVRLSGKCSITFGRGVPGQPGPTFSVGDGTFIGHACGFNVGAAVTIGRHCLLATGVLIYDQDGHPLDAARRRAGEPSPPESVAPVTLGNDVWVGSGAVILKGVTVGDRAVVAARSVVTKDVPADSVVAGNPARVVLALPLTPAPLDAT